MKTIDAVIEQCEEIANASKQHTLHMTHFSQSYDEWAEEWTQIAEWLKELKDYRKTWDEIKKQIKEESNFAYADFDQYKYEVLGVDDIDELPDDDFRYGMERALEIINEYIRVVKE